MRIWADVYDVAGNRLGAGSIKTLIGVSVKRLLDGAGSLSFTLPATDERALSLLTNERRVKLYVQQGENAARELGTMIVQKRTVSEDASGRVLAISGPSQLGELARKSVLLGRKFTNTALATVVSNLAALGSGWTVTADGGMPNVSARFDGISVLKALIILAEQNGKHLREGSTGKTLEFGAFGELSTARIYGNLSHVRELDPNVMLVERISVETATEEVMNWIIPLGAGDGDAALTLQHSTRTTPYTIQTTTLPDGRTAWYLSDAASITDYGEMQRVIKFGNIAPLENSDTAIERAANALYDAAAAYLQRAAQQQQSYSISCARVQTTVQPGQKIHVTYKGLAETPGGAVVYLDLRDDFWVMEVEESISNSGIRLRLKINRVDILERDTVAVVVDGLEQIEVQQTAIQSYPVVRPFVYVRQIANGFPASVPIRITDATLTLIRCKVWLRTRPFRATASAAASGGGATSSAGGNHRHLMFKSTGVTGSDATFYYRYYTTARANGNQDLSAYLFQSPDSSDLYTYDSSGDHTHTLPPHTHPLTYGITDDTQTPVNLRLKLNGVDITSALGGPWFPAGGSNLVELTLTDPLLATAGGIRQEHQLEVRCDSGQGELEAIVETFEVVQTLAIS